MNNLPTNKAPKHGNVGASGRSQAASSAKPAPSSVLDGPGLIEPAATDGGAEVIRVRKRRKKHMSKGKKITLGIVIALVAAAVLAGAAFALSVQQSAKNATDYSNADIQTTENAVTYSSGKTVDYNGHTYQLNENMVSMVFMGVDATNQQTGGAVAGQSDAIMVLAMDTSTGKSTIIAIPRDSMVDVDVTGTGGQDFVGSQKMQICLAYDYGDGAASSAQNVVKSVQRTLYNMPMKYYFALQLEGIGPMADAIDGVSLNALQTIPNTNIVKGEDVILFDNNAQRYVQWRDTTQMDSAADRLARQKQFVSAFAKQALAQAQGNVGNLVALYNTVQQYSNTNLSTSDFTYLAGIAASKGITDLNMVSLAGTYSMGQDYAEFNLDSTSVYETVLSTYYTQIS